MSTLYDEAYFDGGVGYPAPYTITSAPWQGMASTIHFIFGGVGYRSISDFGCARGFVLHFLKMQGWEVQGYDISSYAIKTAMPGIPITKQDITKPFKPRQTDLALCMDTLEHIPLDKMPIALANIKKATRKFVIAQVGVRDGTPGHVTIMPYEEWQVLFAKNGLLYSQLTPKFRLQLQRFCWGALAKDWASRLFVLEKADEDDIPFTDEFVEEAGDDAGGEEETQADYDTIAQPSFAIV